jgi:hypothetical protein
LTTYDLSVEIMPMRRRATAVVGLVWAAVLCGGLQPTSGDTVEWHIVTNRAPTTAFTLNPANATTTNIISFVAPTDGQMYDNSCFASRANGDPSISVDSTNQIVSVSFSPPVTNRACPLVILLVSGVDGEIGPLQPGAWTFNILGSSYSFTVAEAPLALSIEPFANASSFQISWSASGEPFVLEFSDGLSSATWQVVTNTPVTVSNRNTVSISSESGSRFFRLRRP